MAARPSPWPQAIGELLPLVLFRLAAEHPDITYAMFPINPTNISLGYRKITFAQVANAVHAMAWWFEGNVGKLGEDKKDGSETLVYMGPNDIRYAVLCLGSVVAGYKVCLLSNTKTTEGKEKGEAKDMD
jgi:acyl-CoA synthetase (AMP-forming)/AMP-acid ligase II